MKAKELIGGLLALGALVVIANERLLTLLLRLFFPGQAEPLYPLATPVALLGQHLVLALGASAIAAILGFLGGSLAHFRGSSLKSLILGLGALAQTVPPVAVLALAVPVLGFGNKSVLFALALYGILPVIHGTLAGLESVSPDAVDAARGLGMSRIERFRIVELPLALPAVAAGLRTSVLINVGTAAIGAAMGAGGLGRPIMAGLVQFKTSYVVQGALAAAVLALALDWLFARAERALARA